MRTKNSDDFKLGVRGTDIGRSNITRNIFWYRAYEIYNNIPGIITRTMKHKLFSKRTKRWILNKDDIPDSNDPRNIGNIHARITHEYYNNPS